MSVFNGSVQDWRLVLFIVVTFNNEFNDSRNKRQKSDKLYPRYHSTTSPSFQIGRLFIC